MKPNGEAEGPSFTRTCGEHELRGYLHIGTQIAFPRAHTYTDDRENYQYGIEFAKVHYAILPLQCIGVHLFIFHGESNIALTARGLTGWCRTYSVITPMPEIGYVEFLFDFFMQSPFKVFCRYAYQMERVVQSLAFNQP